MSVTMQTNTTSAAGHVTSPAAVGTKLADFTLPLATKDGKQEFNLAQHLGKGPIILGFYPLAFTGVCTKEMCDFRDNLGKFQGLGAQVFGFSIDTPFANVEFVKSQNANYGVISDPNREVVGRFWPTMTVGGVHHVAKRGVMILSGEGVVQWTSVSDDPKVWIGTDEVRKHL